MVRSHAQHLEALLAEQRLIAAQKPNLQLCWKFLEEEIARVRAAEKVNPTRTTPVKTPSGRAKHTPTPTKKPTPERHGKHARRQDDANDRRPGPRAGLGLRDEHQPDHDLERGDARSGAD